jgi:phosphoribosylamine--glycine ligase
MGDNVVVIGSGGREDAIARAFAESQGVSQVVLLPGNGAAQAQLHEKFVCYDIKASDIEGIKSFLSESRPALTFIGPEDPLIAGLAGDLRNYGLRVIGPGADGARLEGSKKYAREKMREYNIPGPDYRVFTDYDSAKSYLKGLEKPVFVKASGPARGKGALDGETEEMALHALYRIMKTPEFAKAGKTVVIEDKLYGEEASATLLVNSQAGILVPFPYSQDHKRQLDGDLGPNTGGMGAYAPTTLITPELDRRIRSKIFDGFMKMTAEMDYTGVIYPALMISDGQPDVLEINVRLGDPEALPLLTLLETDFYEACQRLIDGNLKPEDVKFRDGYAVCVVAASGWYPNPYETGKLILGLDSVDPNDPDIRIYHAGTKFENGSFYTSGGRVLSVTAYGKTIQEAIARAYATMEKIHFEGMLFRTDIGMRERSRCP